MRIAAVCVLPIYVIGAQCAVQAEAAGKADMTWQRGAHRRETVVVSFDIADCHADQQMRLQRSKTTSSLIHFRHRRSCSSGLEHGLELTQPEHRPQA